MRILFFVTTLLVLSASCRKNNTANPCKDALPPKASFVTKEIVGDTSFIADTVFLDNFVEFAATQRYDSVKWKIGSDPRTFTQSSFSLGFPISPSTLTVNFAAWRLPAGSCFANDSGKYNATQPLTFAEQFDRATLTVSPLRGSYRGAFTDNPSDIFTVQVLYLDSAKYSPSITGARNFYWLNNIPNGYVDNTSAPAMAYPELRFGHRLEMGYKSFVFGASGSSCVQGKGWLSHDTLYINYGNTVCGRKQFIGKRL